MRIIILGDTHSLDPALHETLLARLRRDGHRVYRRDFGCDPSGPVVAEGIHLAILDCTDLSAGRAASLCYSLRQDAAAMLLLIGVFEGSGVRAQLLEAGGRLLPE